MTTQEKRRSRRAVKQKEARAQRADEKKAAAAKVKNGPAAKMGAKVTRGELLGVQMTLQNHLQVLQQQTSQSVQQLWQNDAELRDGNRAGEFNLRAHQKAINGMALDLDRLCQAFQLLSDHVFEGDEDGGVKFELMTKLRDIGQGATANRLRTALLDRAFPAVYAAPVFFHYLNHFA